MLQMLKFDSVDGIEHLRLMLDEIAENVQEFVAVVAAAEQVGLLLVVAAALV